MNSKAALLEIEGLDVIFPFFLQEKPASQFLEYPLMNLTKRIIDSLSHDYFTGISTNTE